MPVLLKRGRMRTRDYTICKRAFVKKPTGTEEIEQRRKQEIYLAYLHKWTRLVSAKVPVLAFLLYWSHVFNPDTEIETWRKFYFAKIIMKFEPMAGLGSAALELKWGWSQIELQAMSYEFPTRAISSLGCGSRQGLNCKLNEIIKLCACVVQFTGKNLFKITTQAHAKQSDYLALVNAADMPP